MKVVAINSSPNMGAGNTALILNPFLEGMKEAGADVELFYTKKLKINPCQGELNCWFKTPGKCIHKDDMEVLTSIMAEADLWVIATPVYVDGMSGAMKDLIDRLIIPLVQPFFELRDGHCRHPRREGTKSGKIVLVSSCGYYEMDNFNPLLAHMEAICQNADREFAGALLRPNGTGMRQMLQGSVPLDDIFAAAKEGGRQLVVDGNISAETLKTVSRELMPVEQFMQGANQWIQLTLEGLEGK